MDSKPEFTTRSVEYLSPIPAVKTSRNRADRGGVVGHSQDSGLENCEFAEQKSGAGEGNRTLVIITKEDSCGNSMI
jgi:hypothetical protein